VPWATVITGLFSRSWTPIRTRAVVELASVFSEVLPKPLANKWMFVRPSLPVIWPPVMLIAMPVAVSLLLPIYNKTITVLV